jgi:hypothetical protein
MAFANGERRRRASNKVQNYAAPIRDGRWGRTEKQIEVKGSLGSTWGERLVGAASSRYVWRIVDKMSG